ncbi:WD40 repeat-like protein [Xylona heveae TC161]|uniref:WD40 repeat-like protein n=1 Tax=Xylona heveae (strain CBS 132557 / TC161) TaxID=1328760 RepID=A0A165F7Z7_XYLHT|nr:WD40 repeat-like protein [Xylona heveae TC161]KZF20680.1 WD40 repeat-like protein [Xylona heveae TC161]
MMPAATTLYMTDERPLIDLNNDDELNFFQGEARAQLPSLSRLRNGLDGSSFDSPHSFHVRDFLPRATANRKQPFDQRAFQTPVGQSWHSFRGRDRDNQPSRPLSHYNDRTRGGSDDSQESTSGNLASRNLIFHEANSKGSSPADTLERKIRHQLEDLSRDVSTGIDRSDMRHNLDHFHRLLDQVEQGYFSASSKADMSGGICKTAFTLLRQQGDLSGSASGPIPESSTIQSPFNVEPAQALALAMRLFRNDLVSEQVVPCTENDGFLGDSMIAEEDILPEFYQYLVVSFRLSSHELENLELLIDTCYISPFLKSLQQSKPNAKNHANLSEDQQEQICSPEEQVGRQRSGGQSSYTVENGRPVKFLELSANNTSAVKAVQLDSSNKEEPPDTNLVRSETERASETLDSFIVEDYCPLTQTKQTELAKNGTSNNIALETANAKSKCALVEDAGRPLVPHPSNHQRKPAPNPYQIMHQQTLTALEPFYSDTDRPYIDHRTVQTIKSGLSHARWGRGHLPLWNESILHVDFTDEEIEDLIKSIILVRENSNNSTPEMSLREKIVHLLKGVTAIQIANVVNHSHGKRKLEPRARQSIVAFLRDASEGMIAKKPRLLRARHVDSDQVEPKSSHKTQALLRLRELGACNSRGLKISSRFVREELARSLGLQFRQWKTFTGASSDVIIAAWSPHGNVFAVGATSYTDINNMQYNRKNNLLLGNIANNVLEELPDHCIDRPRPESFSFGANANAATYNTCDSKLYMTVTAAQFSSTGRELYTASYDKTVKIWDVASAQCRGTLQHDGEISLLATSRHYPGIISTGSSVLGNSIRTYSLNHEDLTASGLISFGPKKTTLGNGRVLHPSCLQWGPNPWVKHLLVAGFSASSQVGEPDSPDPLPEGDLICYDAVADARIEVLPSKQNVFDCAWHPEMPYFAAATVKGGLIAERSTRSIVKVFDPLRSNRTTIEYECPALDINDVTFCPSISNYITAGCTNGVTYVWDFRMGHKVLHQLQHGGKYRGTTRVLDGNAKDPSEPIATLNADLSREQFDTGVRLAAWGEKGDELYTGSSDGIVKSWDIKRSSDDVFISDVARLQAGIMCGAFSPDYSNLLIGDASSAIHVLTTSGLAEDNNVEEMRLQSSCAFLDTPEDTALQCGRELIERGELVTHPVFGVGKGPNYRGPYARYARRSDVPPSSDDPLLPHNQARQLCPVQRSLAGPGPSLSENERNLLEVQTEIAYARNARRQRHQPPPKRAHPSFNYDTDEEDELQLLTDDRRQKPFRMGSAKDSTLVVDLTIDESPSSDKSRNGNATGGDSGVSHTDTMKFLDPKLEDNDSDWLEDDYWQPYWGC